jgi:predicted ABC-type ATPase
LNGQPFVLVVAGPNGSGKTTLTRYLLDSGIDFGIYINPDEIAQGLDLPEPQRSAQAQRNADFQRDACLQHKQSFSFETVMSHPSKVELMIRAQDAGYDVILYFVGTSDPEINVRRVEGRVGTGGHDVPHDRIRARYWRSLSLLSHAALVARRSVVFDNSALVSSQQSLVGSKAGLRPVAQVNRQGNAYRIAVEAEVPQWVFEHLVEPLANVAAVSEGKIEVSIRQEDGPLV